MVRTFEKKKKKKKEAKLQATHKQHRINKFHLHWGPALSHASPLPAAIQADYFTYPPTSKLPASTSLSDPHWADGTQPKCMVEQHRSVKTVLTPCLSALVADLVLC